jgi:hypothetical protein
MHLQRLSVAVFVLTGAALGFDAAAHAERNGPVNIVGTVVDAACYMMHPDAAQGPSHDECGEACVLAGVPLGVSVASEKALYLTDAEGSKKLLPYLHKRVRVEGNAVKKSEPLTLEMPVGPSNTMTVRVDGGYLALTVNRVELVGQAPVPR